MEIDREFVYGDLRYETVNDNIRARRCYLDWLTYHGSSHRTLHLHPFELSMCSNSGRLRVVPHFLWRDSKESKTRARLKITPREEGEIRRGERKIRDYSKAKAFDPSRSTDFGVWSSYRLSNQLRATNEIPSLIELSLLFKLSAVDLASSILTKTPQSYIWLTSE